MWSIYNIQKVNWLFSYFMSTSLGSIVFVRFIVHAIPIGFLQFRSLL